MSETGGKEMEREVCVGINSWKEEKEKRRERKKQNEVEQKGNNIHVMV